MPRDQEIAAGQEVSEEYRSYEEFCVENSGRELAYLEMVQQNPLEMDPTTLAFSLRHLLRLSGPMLDLLLDSLPDDVPPDLASILSVKGVGLDKAHAAKLRKIIFAFRDSGDGESASRLVRAFQLMAIGRERRNVVLSLGESYAPPEEGWLPEDFGGDEFAMETVLSVEDPVPVETEET